MLGRHLNSRPNLLPCARGAAGQTTRRPRWHIPDTKPAPVPAVLHLAIIGHFQRWLGALTGSSRVSQEGFPQGGPLTVSRKAPAKKQLHKVETDAVHWPGTKK